MCVGRLLCRFPPDGYVVGVKKGGVNHATMSDNDDRMAGLYANPSTEVPETVSCSSTCRWWQNSPLGNDACCLLVDRLE